MAYQASLSNQFEFLLDTWGRGAGFEFGGTFRIP